MTLKLTIKSYCDKRHLNAGRYIDLMGHVSRYPNVYRPIPATKAGKNSLYRQPDLDAFVKSCDENVPPRKAKPTQKFVPNPSKDCKDLDRRVRALEKKVSEIMKYAHIDEGDLFK